MVADLDVAMLVLRSTKPVFSDVSVRPVCCGF